MNNINYKIKNSIYHNSDQEINKLLNYGLDPNFEGGWPIRLAARHGSYLVVKALLQGGANPHLLGESGASTLQLAVYSGEHWDDDKWKFLLSCCDSSQLADGAAVAIIFNRVAAFKLILETGRCNTNIPTTLTGKTVEQLAKGYKMDYLIIAVPQSNQQNSNVTPTTSGRLSRLQQTDLSVPSSQRNVQRNLSPSVARFFDQTSRQTALSPHRATLLVPTSPSSQHLIS